MNLKEKLTEDFKKAFKEKKELEVSTLRMLLAALKNKEIELRPKNKELEDEDITDVFKKEGRKRKDSIEAFEKGGREDLVLKEKEELEIIKRYLPEPLSEEEISKIIKEKISLLKATEKDFGKVMAEVMKELKGKAEGNIVSKIVKDLLKS